MDYTIAFVDALIPHFLDWRCRQGAVWKDPSPVVHAVRGRTA